MIVYDQPLYRPPSEARSLIFQVTLGCSHNRCAFCVSYQNKRFRIRKLEDVFAEIDEAAQVFPDTRRVFLADGDAMAVKPERMVRILERLYARFERLQRVTAYAGPGNLLPRQVERLAAVRRAGLSMLYFGLESGDDEVLERVDKGYSQDEMVAACDKAHQAGFDLSVTVILGLAGPKGSARHARATAQALDRIRPRFAAALTLMLEPRRPSFAECYGDPDWRPLDASESLVECRELLAHMQADGITFRSNHASNYVALKGDLQRDKQRLLDTIDQALSDPASPLRRPDWMRAL
jgi:radical SAM superfamily enzyme YgiQ (UPF0313 family)